MKYITDVVMRRGFITDQLTFVTSRGRQVSFGGGMGRFSSNASESTGPNSIFVTLYGTENGVLHRFSFVAEMVSSS